MTKLQFGAKDFIICALVIIICILGGCSRVYYQKYRNGRGEICIINDTLSVYKNRLGEEYIQKHTYVMQVD